MEFKPNTINFVVTLPLFLNAAAAESNDGDRMVCLPVSVLNDALSVTNGTAILTAGNESLRFKGGLDALVVDVEDEDDVDDDDVVVDNELALDTLIVDDDCDSSIDFNKANRLAAFGVSFA